MASIRKQVHEELLSDRVTNLHTCARHIPGGRIHRCRGKCSPSNAVAASGPAENDNPVARKRALRHVWGFSRSDAPGENKRVGDIPGVIKDCARKGWKSDLVAVVSDPCDHTRSHTPGMDHTVRKQRIRGICRSETQDVRACNRTVGRPKDIPDHTSNACIRSTKRLDGTRMVMGFALDSESCGRSELENSSVANKRAYDVSRINLGSCATKLVEERGNFITGCCGNSRAERLMGAVF